MATASLQSKGGRILRIGNVRDQTGKLISQPSSTKAWFTLDLRGL